MSTSKPINAIGQVALPVKKGPRAVKPSAKNKKKKGGAPKASRRAPGYSKTVAREVHEMVHQMCLLQSKLTLLKDDPADLVDSQALTRTMMRSALAGRGEKVSVWLSNSMGNVASSAGAQIALTYSAFLSNCAGYAEWITVFSTYRLKAATFDYKPYFKGSSTNTGQCAMGVRYGSNVTAPASTLEVQQLEESKVVPMCDEAHASASFGSGYSDFIAIAFPSTVYASWLLFSSSTSGVGISTNYGSVSGRILVEFEGLL